MGGRKSSTLPSASGALLPAPSATSAREPYACLQPALVMSWLPTRHACGTRAMAGQQVGSGVTREEGAPAPVPGPFPDLGVITLPGP